MGKKIASSLVRYFLQGLLFLAPVVVTVWALYISFNFIDNLLKTYIEEAVGYSIPGLGLISVLLLVTLIGMLGSTIIFKPIVKYFDRLMVNVPLIKIIYTAVKDLVSAFVGQKKRFNEPVLVKVGADLDMEKIGFITNKDLEHIGINEERVAVYLPHSYAWSGNLFIVPASNIRRINASPTEVMKFIIAAGVTELEELSVKKTHD